MDQFTPMNKSLLITRPNHDPTTNYLFYWCQPLIKLAKSKGFTVHDLAKNRASKKELDSHLHSRDIGIIFFNGHGNEHTIGGHNNEVLIDSRSNLTLLSHMVMYIRSCQVMVELGGKLISAGATSCIGYSRKFGFFRSTNHTTHPLTDPYARVFLEPSNLVISTLLKGHTTQESFIRSQKAMKKNLRRLLSSASHSDLRSMAFALLTNIKGQTIYGDQTAKLY